MAHSSSTDARDQAATAAQPLEPLDETIFERSAAVSGAPLVERRSGSVAQTRQLGETLGALLQSGDIVLLSGDLGAGKTAFTQGIGRGLAISGAINSPTFTILKEYHGRLPLYHFDLYRLEDPTELDPLGFDDYFDGVGVSVIEWAERGASLAGSTPWPTQWLAISFARFSSEARALRFCAIGARGLALLTAFAQSTQALAPQQEGA